MKHNLKIDATLLKPIIKMLALYAANDGREDIDKRTMVSVVDSSSLCTFYTENGVSALNYDCKCIPSHTDFSFVVHTRPLIEILKNAIGKIEFIIDEDNITIKFGRSRYKIPTTTIAHPILVPEDIPVQKLDLERLKYKFGCINQCLAKDDLVPALQNVYIHNDYLMASDSIYGAVTKYTGINKLSGNTFSPFCVSVFGAIQGDVVEIGFKDQKMVGYAGDFSFVIAVDDIEYPINEMKPIIDGMEKVKQDGEVAIVLPPINTMEAIERLCFLLDKGTPTLAFNLDVKNSLVKIYIENHDFEGSEEIPVTLEKPLEYYSFSFDGKSFLRALKPLNGDCYLYALDSDGVQYVTDAETCIFFYGVAK